VSPRFLLDTNIISEPLRPEPNKRVLENLQAHQEGLTIASVVWHELLFRYNCLPDSKRKQAIESYLFEVVSPSIAILPYDENAAQWHAKERARLASVGRTPSFADGQIAAIAAINDLSLVTINEADYAGFEDLAIVSWHK